LRVKRHIDAKEVIIEEPDYAAASKELEAITHDVVAYSERHNLKRLPNPIKVFFRYAPDHEIERINGKLENVIESLSNTRDSYVLSEINHYPIMAVKAHTRPFERKWLNILSFIIIPLGMFFYFRMWRFRLRLLRDLRIIHKTNDNIVSYIGKGEVRTDWKGRG
jgi:lipopolysaccharide export system permease protein